MQDAPIANTLEFAKSKGLDHLAVVGSLKSLAADNYVVMEAEDHESWKLSEEGVLAADQGSPEARVFSMVRLPASPPPTRWKLPLFVDVCQHVCCLVTPHIPANTHSTICSTTSFTFPHTRPYPFGSLPVALWVSP